MLDLTCNAQTVRNVLLELLESKEQGKANMKVERLCALLDPRRKTCSAAHLVNGGPAVRICAEAKLKSVGNVRAGRFPGKQFRQNNVMAGSRQSVPKVKLAAEEGRAYFSEALHI